MTTLYREQLTLSQLSSKYGVGGKTIQNWERQFLENPSLAFDPCKVVGVYKDEINNLKND
ncbi:hypothetical protein [Candidatus Cardinium hertigii]|uniref:hypothetical protein n=1 Tax=Candidatus Cardinium hertigii TaxID=247481 RepID=UPI003D7C4116